VTVVLALLQLVQTSLNQASNPLGRFFASKMADHGVTTCDKLSFQLGRCLQLTRLILRGFPADSWFGKRRANCLGVQAEEPSHAGSHGDRHAGPERDCGSRS
jgi:hypothetical protein